MNIENLECGKCNAMCVKTMFPDCLGVSDPRFVYSGYMEVDAYFLLDSDSVTSRRIFGDKRVMGLSGKEEMVTTVPILCRKT